MNNYITSYYIGCNDKDAQKQIKSNSFIKGYLQTVLNKFYDAYTIKESNTGCYKSVNENTFIIELVNDHLTTDIIEDIKEVLNQECIMEVVTPCDVNFV